MTVQTAIEEFLIEQQIRGNTDNTVQHYKRCLTYFMVYLSNDTKRIENITIADCKRYYMLLKERNTSTTTVQTYIRALRAFLSWCYTEEYIPVNIPERFRLPKAQRRTIDILTPAESRRLMVCFNKSTFTGARNFCICALMLDSGLRLNEVVQLETGKLHIAEGYVIVNGKGNKERIVPLGLQSKKALIRYTSYLQFDATQTTLFVKDNLTAIKKSTIQQLFRKLKIRADIPRLRPHLLRHTFATRYLENGGDIYSLQSILGHTSLEMVKKYVHLTSTKTVVNFRMYSPLDTILKQ